VRFHSLAHLTVASADRTAVFKAFLRLLIEHHTRYAVSDLTMRK
jgi:hypothetical protein